MDKLKAFIEKKKLNAKFKKAGTGHTLTGPANAASSAARPPQNAPTQQQQQEKSAADAQAQAAAAQAALSRTQQQKPQLTRSQQTIRAQAKKELEEASRAPKPRQTEEAQESVPAAEKMPVLFTCELLSEDIVLPKALMTEAVEEFLLAYLEDSPLDASVLMVHSLNTNPDRRRLAVDILVKYLDNIIQNPDVEKFRKIRVGNKVFQERIEEARGGREFLKAVGFVEEQLCPSLQSEPELYLVLPAEVDMGKLESSRKLLAEGRPVPLKLNRNRTVLKASSQPLGQVQLPDTFFARTADDIRVEQKTKSEEVDKLLTLRTQEMRMRDEKVSVRKYKYSLLRIKFPAAGDGLQLQGTFSALEKLAEVRKFVQESLEIDWAPFVLKGPDGVVLAEKRDGDPLSELNLVPAALLYFEWDTDVAFQLSQTGTPFSFLKKELVEQAIEL